MNIAILSRGESLYSTQSLLKAGLARNHTMEVLDPGSCHLSIEDGKPLLYVENELVDDLHAGSVEKRSPYIVDSLGHGEADLMWSVQ